MKKYDLLTPEGTRDLVFDECVALRKVEERLRTIFESHGYSEVITPGLEFFDVFFNKSRYLPQESMYKLSDGKGRLMVIRPDSTMPIARLVGTRLKDSKLPVKLFYNQTIYRANPKNSGRDDEFSQAGIEIIGGDTIRADMESLSIATEVMEAFETEDYRFEIGDSGFFRLLSAKLSFNENEMDALRVYVQTKNYPALKDMLSPYENDPYVAALIKLPELFGGSEVFDKAEKILPDEETKNILSSLKKIYNGLCDLGIKDKVTVDLGLIGKNEDYYTGIVFKGYIEGCGTHVLSGGRYDSLIAGFGVDTPATGFAINENAVAGIILKKQGKELMTPPDVLIFAEENCIVQSVKYCRKLISEGLRVDYADFATLEEAKEYAKTRNIKRLDVITPDGVRIL